MNTNAIIYSLERFFFRLFLYQNIKNSRTVIFLHHWLSISFCFFSSFFRCYCNILHSFIYFCICIQICLLHRKLRFCSIWEWEQKKKASKQTSKNYYRCSHFFSHAAILMIIVLQSHCQRHINHTSSISISLALLFAYSKWFVCLVCCLCNNIQQFIH